MKKYQVLYADPPWRYDFSKSSSRKIENQYPTMSIEEICAMDIPSDDNAVLYMWTTAPKLEESFKVMKAWNFKYKSSACWDKGKIGIGYWFRNQHEILMVGVKGKMSPPKAKLRISSVIRIERGDHSRKPEFVRDMIARWYPKFDKIEIFARRKAIGWDTFGNEVDCDVEIETPENTRSYSFENF